MEPNNIDQLMEMFAPGLWLFVKALVWIIGGLALGAALCCLSGLCWHCGLGLRDGLRVRARQSPRRSVRLPAVPTARFPTTSRAR